MSVRTAPSSDPELRAGAARWPVSAAKSPMSSGQTTRLRWPRRCEAKSSNLYSLRRASRSRSQPSMSASRSRIASSSRSVIVSPVRIASLVPSATETLFALGLGDDVVAVTHECDYPPEALELPHITRSAIPEGLGAGEIDREVRERIGRGEAIYELDHPVLRDLHPELIVTQALCEVCAVSSDDVRALAEELHPAPQVLSLDPTTLGEVLAGARDLAAAAG